MSADTGLRTYSLCERFDQATNADTLRSRFEQELSMLWKEEVSILSMYIPRVFPRNDDSFVVQYVLELKKGDSPDTTNVTLCGLLLRDESEYPSWVAKSKGKLFKLSELRLVLPLFPFDPKLDELETLVGCKRAGQLHRNYSGFSTLIKNPETRIGFDMLAYRLERRSVLRLSTISDISDNADTQPKSYVIKLLRAKKVAKILESTELLMKSGFSADSDDSCSSPDILYACRDKGIIVMEDVRGVSVNDMIGDNSFVLGCRASGRILKKLHSTKQNLPQHDYEDELQLLDSMWRRIKAIRPGLLSACTRSLEVLRNEAESVKSYDPVCIHRDFYDKQVLWSTTRTTLLDTDNLAIGDRALDLANFLTHLDLRKMQTPEIEADIDKGHSAFLEGYGEKSDETLKRVRWWGMASRIRLAMLYSLRPRWKHLAEVLLARSNKI